MLLENTNVIEVFQIRYGTNFSASHLIKRTQFLKTAYGRLELELAVVES